MPVRPAIRPAYPREARHRHGASVRAPCLRSTVSIRCLRQLRCVVGFRFPIAAENSAPLLTCRHPLVFRCSCRRFWALIRWHNSRPRTQRPRIPRVRVNASAPWSWTSS